MKKSVKPEPSAAGVSVVKKVIAVIVCFLGSILLAAETYSLLVTVIPYVSIAMFQATGMTVAEGLTFGEFSVGDTIVLCMMWLFPCLCGVGLACAAQWALIKFAVVRMCRLARNAFFGKRPAVQATAGKNTVKEGQ